MKMVFAAICVTVILTGCTVIQTGANPGGQSNLAPVYIEDVAIVDVVPVVIQTNRSNAPKYVGAVGGAALGGLLGNQIGNGNGKKWATVLGTVAGGIAGAAAVDAAATPATAPGLEIVVRRKNGELKRLVQPTSADRFIPGQTVRLTQTANGVWHVSPLPPIERL